MKRVLSSLSGLTWLINDILWYWGYNTAAFVVCCFTVLFMGTYFINLKYKENPSNFFIVLILNIWVWMSMCSLIKDAFKTPPDSNITIIVNHLALVLSLVSMGIIIRLLTDKDAVLSRLRRI
jgi:hypothetical protein